MSSKGAENPTSKHNPQPRDSNQQIRAGKTGDEGEVCEEQGHGQGPVYIAQPEDLAEVFVTGVGGVLVGVFYVRVIVGYALAG